MGLKVNFLINMKSNIITYEAAKESSSNLCFSFCKFTKWLISRTQFRTQASSINNFQSELVFKLDKSPIIKHDFRALVSATFNLCGSDTNPIFPIEFDRTKLQYITSLS